MAPPVPRFSLKPNSVWSSPAPNSMSSRQSAEVKKPEMSLHNLRPGTRQSAGTARIKSGHLRINSSAEKERILMTKRPSSLPPVLGAIIHSSKGISQTEQPNDYLSVVVARMREREKTLLEEELLRRKNGKHSMSLGDISDPNFLARHSLTGLPVAFVRQEGNSRGSLGSSGESVTLRKSKVSDGLWKELTNQDSNNVPQKRPRSKEYVSSSYSQAVSKLIDGYDTDEINTRPSGSQDTDVNGITSNDEEVKEFDFDEGDDESKFS